VESVEKNISSQLIFAHTKIWLSFLESNV